MNTYSLRLKKLRGKKTQAYVAQKIGINRQTYCNYENGDRQADYDTLIKMAQYHNVTIDYLLGASDLPNGYNATYEIELAPEAEDERRILDLYRAVKEKGGNEAAIKFIDLLSDLLLKKGE